MTLRMGKSYLCNTKDVYGKSNYGESKAIWTLSYAPRVHYFVNF